MLFGAAVVIALMRDRGDDAGLVVVPADASRCRPARGSPSARRRRATSSRAAIASPSASVTPMRIGAGLEIRHRGRRAARRPRAFAFADQRVDQRTGSRSCARTARPARPRRRRSGTSAAPRRRAWNRSPPCRGSAARPRRPPSQTPMVSNSRRAAAAIAEARGSPAARVPAPDRRPSTAKRAAEPLPQRDGQRQPGKAAAARSAHRSLRSLRSLLPGRTIARLERGAPHLLYAPQRKSCIMSAAVSDSARHPRSRTARGEPVPRPLAADRLAARVRRPGDRPGAGRRHAAPSRARRRIRCTPISCWPAIRRCRSSTTSTASATARASPRAASSRSSTASRSSRCRCRSTTTRTGLDHQVHDAGRAAAGRAAERSRDQARRSCRRCPKPVRRYYERERPIELRPVEFDRYLGKKPTNGRFNVWITRHRPAAGRSGDPPLRAGLCLRHDAARHRAGAARPHACSRRTSWARASTMRCGCTGRSAPTNGCSTRRTARTCTARAASPRPDLHARRHPGGLGGAGRPGAAAAAAASRSYRTLKCTAPRDVASACG